jgi:hypothetical protein
MKFLVVLIILLASGCAIKDCKVDPTLEITSKDSKDTASDKNINMGAVRDLARDATKGGQVTCRF